MLSRILECKQGRHTLTSRFGVRALQVDCDVHYQSAVLDMHIPMIRTPKIKCSSTDIPESAINCNLEGDGWMQAHLKHGCSFLFGRAPKRNEAIRKGISASKRVTRTVDRNAFILIRCRYYLWRQGLSTNLNWRLLAYVLELLRRAAYLDTDCTRVVDRHFEVDKNIAIVKENLIRLPRESNMLCCTHIQRMPQVAIAMWVYYSVKPHGHWRWRPLSYPWRS